jgi:hypothetical protein
VAGVFLHAAGGNNVKVTVHISGPLWAKVLLFPVWFILEMWNAWVDWFDSASWVTAFVTAGLAVAVLAGIIIEVTT